MFNASSMFLHPVYAIQSNMDVASILDMDASHVSVANVDPSGSAASHWRVPYVGYGRTRSSMSVFAVIGATGKY